MRALVAPVADRRRLGSPDDQVSRRRHSGERRSARAHVDPIHLLARDRVEHEDAELAGRGGVVLVRDPQQARDDLRPIEAEESLVDHGAMRREVMRPEALAAGEVHDLEQAPLVAVVTPHLGKPGAGGVDAGNQPRRSSVRRCEALHDGIVLPRLVKDRLRGEVRGQLVRGGDRKEAPEGRVREAGGSRRRSKLADPGVRGGRLGVVRRRPCVVRRRPCVVGRRASGVRLAQRQRAGDAGRRPAAPRRRPAARGGAR